MSPKIIPKHDRKPQRMLHVCTTYPETRQRRYRMHSRTTLEEVNDPALIITRKARYDASVEERPRQNTSIIEHFVL